MFDFSIGDVDGGEIVKGMSFKSGSEYYLIRRLGRGGMGEVWLAHRKSAAGHVHNVAVKFLTDPGSGGESLAVEALRMSRLSHDNIVQFVDSGVDADGRCFVAMAFVEGMDLDGLRQLAKGARPSVGESVAAVCLPGKIVGFIMFMTLRAIGYAHTFDFGDGVVGLIHRDVSPGNILIDEQRGFIKLSDFGVAAIQDPNQACGQIAGKIPYMAPEVLLEDPIDARTDIYALGVVAYELITGFNPNMRLDRSYSVLGAISEVMLSFDEPLCPAHELIKNVDKELSGIISKMLKRDKERRYSSANAVLEDLSAYLFDRGFGPTTGSMASYITLLRNPQMRPTERIKHNLRFFDWSSKDNAMQLMSVLTPGAEGAVKEGLNPARSAHLFA